MSQSNKFALFRILGNDLPPCHGPTQTLNNLNYILKNEPPLSNCSKYWIVNNIIDSNKEAQIIELLEKYKQSVLRLPFCLKKYALLPERETVPFKVPWFQFARRRRLQLHEKRSRLNYVTNNNHARNRAIEYGASFAEWILPWDGNCMLTPIAWQEIQTAILQKNPLYFVTPMMRCQKNSDLDLAYIPGKENRTEEPQIGFSAKSQARFNASFYYGRRDKVEMLWRLGVAGPWNLFVDDPWDLPRPKLAHDRQSQCFAGWLYRLENGRSHLWNAFSSNPKQRNRNREKACLALLRDLDKRAKKICGSLNNS